MEFQVKNHGAELYSVIIDNVEYIWNKPEIWAKSSPAVFSIYWDDKRYEI